MAVRRYAARLMADRFTVLVMAAGKGTRMRSSLPKVLHPVLGKPMAQWVFEAARAAGADRVLCVTRPGDGVAEGLPADVGVVEQTSGEGTGAAVLAARGAVDPDATLVILSGDQPLIPAALISELVETHRAEDAGATLLTTESLDPAGLGRIVRTADGAVERVGVADGEIYLTGVFPLLQADGRRIASSLTEDVTSAMGVNSKADLMEIERLAQRRV